MYSRRGCVHKNADAHGQPKMDPPELELKVLVSYPLQVSETKVEYSEHSQCILNH